MATYYNETTSIRPVKSWLPSHRQYDYFFEDWLTMFDTLMGEREVKEQGVRYLPKTQGMLMNPEGNNHYEAYKERAVFPEFTSETALGMYGLFWQKLPQVKINALGDKWMKNATIDGKSFIQAYRDMVYKQITKGRYGMLIDIPEDAEAKDDLPQIVPYVAESIVNWGKKIYKGKNILSFVLLDESSYDLDNTTLQYNYVQRWRYCGLYTHDEKGNELKTPIYFTISGLGSSSEVNTNLELDFNFKYGTDNYNGNKLIYPNYKGKELNYIPFIFVNVTNLDSDIEIPPLKKLANTCIASYRLDADLKQGLFFTSEPTLFGSGIDSSTNIAVGAQAAILIPDKDAKLDYVEISGAGLEIMKKTEDDLKNNAKEMGIQLVQKSSGDETGASVEKHITVQTSTLKSISTTASQAMINVLKIVNDWIGNKFGEPNIVPSQEFSTVNENPDSMYKIWLMFKEGGMSKRDYYESQKQNDVTSFETFEEWEINFDKRIKEIELKEKQNKDINNKLNNSNEVINKENIDKNLENNNITNK